MIAAAATIRPSSVRRLALMPRRGRLLVVDRRVRTGTGATLPGGAPGTGGPTTAPGGRTLRAGPGPEVP